MSKAEKGTKLLTAKMTAMGIVSVLEGFCDRIEVAGSIRRERPIVNDIDIVLVPKRGCADKLKELCLSWHPMMQPGISEPKWGGKMATFSYKGIIEVDLYFADFHSWPLIFLIRTGSKEHNIKLCELAKSKGMYLAADGSGLFRDRDKKEPVAVETEGDVFGALDLPFLEPEDREVE